jgi:glycosyltransferase involved in cell wall biosynthesis
VLHVLSQRPLLTGSGVTLDALVRRAATAGWTQAVVFAQPVGEPVASVGGLGGESLQPLLFGEGALPYAIPGMSDVMPYPSRRFSEMSDAEIEEYEAAWVRHLEGVAATFRPDVVHAHHMWLVGGRLRDVMPATPIVTHCHGTGLRQMSLCPHLAERVRRGCARNDRFAVLHAENGAALARALGVERERIRAVGAGFREDVFHARGREESVGPRVVYAGKLSRAKGLPWLLDAVDRLLARREVTLHVAGSGAGQEAEALRARMRAMAPAVEVHGQLGQEELAELMRRAGVFVLPSMYEGLPLVLIEAAACGCRLVCTDLPGARAELFPALHSVLEVVAMPRLVGADQPVDADLPRLVADLDAAIDRGLDADAVDVRSMNETLAPFTWDAVFERVQRLWRELLDEHQPGAG